MGVEIVDDLMRMRLRLRHDGLSSDWLADHGSGRVRGIDARYPWDGIWLRPANRASDLCSVCDLGDKGIGGRT
jgi:hypothetical protein